MTSHGLEDRDGSAQPSPIVAFAFGRKVMIVIACFTATLSTALVYDVLPPIMGDLAKHFGGGAHGIFIAQLAGTLPLFGVMAGGLMAGRVAEGIGLRATLLGAMALFGVAGSLAVLLDNAMAFLFARLLMGMGAGLMTTACNAMVAIYFRGPPRGRMNGYIISAGAIGGIVFVLIAGLTATWWWRGPFLLHGAIVLAFLIPVLGTGPIPATAPVRIGAIGNLKRLRPMLPICATGFAWFVTMLMSGVKTPFVMAQAGITSHSTIGIVYALNAGSVSIASMLFGHFVPRYRPVVVIRLAFLLEAAGFCVVAVATTAPQFALGLIINGTSVGVGLAAIWTWAMQRAPHDLVARSLGAMTTCLYLGGAMMPLLTAPYERLFGTRGQFPGMAATIVIVVALLWATRRQNAPLARA